MARIAYVNGRYLPIDAAAVRVEDRGYQFADGIYEVIKVVGGRAFDLDRHLDRLERSLRELRIAPPVGRRVLQAILKETLRRNGLADALIYIQITRGVAARNHLFPVRATKPTLTVTVRRPKFPDPEELEGGVRVVSAPDLRWGRCDIKSISLLPNVLARQQAAEQGCREAWLVDAGGRVTEGSASNAYIVDQRGRLITHPLDHRILGGVTRQAVLEIAQSLQIEVVERPFGLAEAKAAPEAALSSTSSWLLPVVAIDGEAVGDGRPGPVVSRIAALYAERLRAG